MGFIPALVGAVGTGLASAVGAHQQQRASQAMAREQMAFQERMSSTAHQREVQDLMKAGLNPMLSVNAGESTPGGAMGQAQNVVGAGMSSAMQMRQLQNDLATGIAQRKGIAARAAADLATAKSTLAGVPTKAVVGDVASDARSLYQQFKDTIRGLTTAEPAPMKVRGPSVLRAISSAKQAQRSDIRWRSGVPGQFKVSSDTLPFETRRP